MFLFGGYVVWEWSVIDLGTVEGLLSMYPSL